MSLERAQRAPEAFRHEAFMYAGQDEFLSGVLAFLKGGLEAGEPSLVVVEAGKIAALRAELGADAGEVMFADMDDVGANPARIIPAWREFVSHHGDPGAGRRGVGEPIFPARSSVEMPECQRHEALLNLAFADTPRFWLLCPYDVDALPPDVIDTACHTHPYVTEGGVARRSHRYAGLHAVAAPFADPLPEPRGAPEELRFTVESLGAVRTHVAMSAARAGLSAYRSEDLLLAATEVATNSIRHGAGEGVLRIWEEEDALVCEVVDQGRFDSPLAGRVRPDPAQIGGYGLWLANQLCHLVQVRSFPAGSVVRLHMRLS